MTTGFDSFDESPLGAFVQTPLDVRNIVRRVLIWDTTPIGDAPEFVEPYFSDMYRSFGVDVDRNAEFNGDIAVYSMIALGISGRGALPSWLQQLDQWSGRLFLSLIPQIETISLFNSLSLRTGMSMGTVVRYPLPTEFPAVPDPLTEGMTVGFVVGQSAGIISGGTSLVVGADWIHQNRLVGVNGPISYVVDGGGRYDSVSLPGEFYWKSSGIRFFSNLLTVAP